MTDEERIELARLEDERNAHGVELSALQAKIARNNAAYRAAGGAMPAQQWKESMAERSRLVAEKAELDAKVNENKGRLKALRAMLSQAENEMRRADGTAELLRRIAALRDKYMNFAADGTRIASMRTMAAEMALDIKSVLDAAKAGGQG